MTNIHSIPTPSRQKFIEYLTLNRKAERTVHTHVSFIYSLARHSRRSPDLLGPEDIRRWLYHLIAERRQAPSTVNLALNAVRSFYGSLLQREIEPFLRQIWRRRRPALAPRLYSMADRKVPDRGHRGQPARPRLSELRLWRGLAPVRGYPHLDLAPLRWQHPERYECDQAANRL
jgi:hypothetical protein